MANCRVCKHNYKPSTCELKCARMCDGESDFEPITNGDKIRKMSDEELAEYLPIVSNFLCRPTDECMKMICNRGECEKTKDCALNWLKSPTTD